MKKQPKTNIKIMMLGDSGVGKSSLMCRFIDEKFSQNFLTTLGVDYKIKEVEIDNKTIQLQIWDTAGQERFHTITNNYYKNVDGIMIVYDITTKQTLDQIPHWFQNIKDHANKNIVIFLIGNKCDNNTQRQVSKEEGEEKAKEFNCQFQECSAKANICVKDAFLSLARQILISKPDIIDDNQQDYKNKSHKLRLTEQGGQFKDNKKSDCC